MIDVGVKIFFVGCGFCIGFGVGFFEKGEVGISVMNRNYKGCMGSFDVIVYFVFFVVVVVFVVKGVICGFDFMDFN